MKDYLVKAYAFDGTVRIYSASTTMLVEEARVIHDTWPAATAALGRTLTASVIMGAMYKEDQTLSIRIDGGGPIGKIMTTTNAHGEVRGFVSNPHVHMSTNAGKLAVGHVVGNNGFIHVTKDVKIRETFTSSASLQTGEIAEDFTYYFAKSEQIPSSVGLGVLVADDNSVIASGGFILQIMPGCTEETLSLIEENIKSMKPVSELIHLGLTPEEVVQELTKGNHEFVQKMDLHYACDCSKERFARGLISLGEKELEEMIQAGETIETTCHFCGKEYHFDIEELKELKHITEKVS
ncbi:MAG: Hsp33 family molecular chaperone HslO [Candidatus Izemoplasmatales bacterium]